jgi:hypothetical protein
MVMYFLTYLVHMDLKKIKSFYNKQLVVFFLRNVFFLFYLDLTCLRCCLICIVFKANFGCLQMNVSTISCDNHSWFVFEFLTKYYLTINFQLNLNCLESTFFSSLQFLLMIIFYHIFNFLLHHYNYIKHLDLCNNSWSVQNDYVH